ncbi:alpha-galactosidase [Clostridium gelidum]|uniref:Alpha-galactosidase n=1 Tax=Clostridium gelidum TaxID=704125 RepID=A0ABN6J5U8_9CLOT|nr:alpha-galactosidase [Clostridium gelidum]BCZ48698.1 alpha-galactosidase [Clostridium gelidum]
MKIVYDSVQKTFHLQNKNISYVMKIIKDGYLVNVYFGKKINKYNESNSIAYYDRGFSPNPDPLDRTFSLDTIPSEYPAYGNGDFRVPAFQVEQKNGSRVTDLRYKSHNIYDGKKKLQGLPSTYVEDEAEAKTLEIVMEDKLIGLTVTLMYTIYIDFDVIARSVSLKNNGEEELNITRAMSASIDYRESNFELITLYGAHINEKNIARRKLVPGIQMVESCRGASSPEQAPFLALVRSDTSEDSGEVYSFNFVYSGNFTAQVQVDQFSNTRVIMGINPSDFSWLLQKGEEFQTPEVIMTYSSDGLNGMSRTYHKLYSTRLCRGTFRDKERPILINNWEATYFDFNADKIKEIAKSGKELGLELFVLDDGWFGTRDDDQSSLGDWIVDKNKLPNGLDDLVNDITNLGMQFGIWFEPEMISEDSDLYRNHPDWALHVPNRMCTVGRSQLVLDLSRKEVCDYIIDAVSNILSNSKITYVKWDMNRHMTDIWSEASEPKRQKETAHRYILGLYYILEALTTKFKHVLFEGCSSGGGRFDAGMIYYMPQTWTSDNSDAVCRLKIQYGTSLVYPPITMGAHVSTVPNHQVGRITPLETRAHVAMSGNFGYELNLMNISQEEKEMMKEQIALYKKIRHIIQFGDFYRILSPFDTNEAAWNFVSNDKTEFVGMYFKILSEPGSSIRTLKFKGLNPDCYYENLETKKVFGGDELMNVGITVNIVVKDFISKLWRFKKTSRME